MEAILNISSDSSNERCPNPECIVSSETVKSQREMIKMLGEAIAKLPQQSDQNMTAFITNKIIDQLEKTIQELSRKLGSNATKPNQEPQTGTKAKPQQGPECSNLIPMNVIQPLIRERKKDKLCMEPNPHVQRQHHRSTRRSLHSPVRRGGHYFVQGVQ